jgi:cytoskeletal protein CcmA (bactofilin family)
MGVITVLAVSAAVFIAGAMLLATAAHQVNKAARERGRSEAGQAADAGFGAAFARLASDATVGWSMSGAMADTGATWTASAAMAPGDPDASHRLVTATGTTSADVPVSRTFEQLVARDDRPPSMAVMAGSSLTAADRVSLVVEGDVAAGGNVVLPPDSRISGSLAVAGNVTSGRRSAVGAIRSGGNTTVVASATVTGDVTASGDLTVAGDVGGDALAGGVATVTGTVGGRTAPQSYLPMAALDPLPVRAAGFATTNLKLALFTDVELSCADLQGVQRIRVFGPRPTRLTGSCSMADRSEATIVADGPVELGASLDSPGHASLSIVAGGTLTVRPGTRAGPSITTQLFAPASALVFAPGATGSTLTGAVAGATVSIDHPLWIHQTAPVPAVDALFDTGSAARSVVTPLSFVER